AETAVPERADPDPGNAVVSEVYVERIPGLPEDFIDGMDISSVIAEEKSGVQYLDRSGNPVDLFEFLAEQGIDTIRVRVWNDPYDDEGHGYGGGNCNAEVAAEIGRRAAAAGMNLLVDFHYSDFWADPNKQMEPKAWAKKSADDKAELAYEYTKKSLTDIIAAGSQVSIVQIGNEINNGLSGRTSKFDVIKILRRASDAVREVSSDTADDIKIAVHFTGVDNKNQIAEKAQWLTDEQLDYDIFGVSYYPFWHGSLSGLTEVLKAAKETTGKDVMILETSFPRTTEDGDFTPNSAGDEHELGNYFVSVQGQAQAIRDVYKASFDGGAIGVCYWEGAWIPVPGDQNEKKRLWEEYGSGWASSYAGSYDPGDAGRYYGGSSWDNQAFFTADGHALDSIHVFRGVHYGTFSEADPMSGYCKDPNAPVVSEVDSLLENSGFEDEDMSMWEVSFEGSDNPTDRQTKEADAMHGENAFHFWSSKAVEFTMKQTISVAEDGTYRATAAIQGGDTGDDAEIYMFAAVNDNEQRSDPIKLSGWVNWKEPVIEFDASAGDSVTVGFYVKCKPGGWGTIDDVSLLSDG
nr:glycosyl hydrolase 53 family protein [Lachnospiraceae bacterium]